MGTKTINGSLKVTDQIKLPDGSRYPRTHYSIEDSTCCFSEGLDYEGEDVISDEGHIEIVEANDGTPFIKINFPYGIDFNKPIYFAAEYNFTEESSGESIVGEINAKMILTHKFDYSPQATKSVSFDLNIISYTDNGYEASSSLYSTHGKRYEVFYLDECDISLACDDQYMGFRCAIDDTFIDHIRVFGGTIYVHFGMDYSIKGRDEGTQDAFLEYEL